MTKKKGIVSKLFLLVVLLTLISCCFLGITFARYVSSESGSATMNVAKWDISSTLEDSTSVEFGTLSPSMDEYDGSTPRTHSTDRTLVATITNSGQVDALVSLTAGDAVLTNTASDWGSYDEEEIQGLFSITFYTNTTDDAAGASVYTDGDEVNVQAETGVLYVYAEVTWTSDDETTFGEAADERDTWVGENITSVGYEISYTAVQNSELPTT